jgi:branched-subunit amino acid aminotransferase/4-amino-4-deoxychorismate lyase
MAASWRRRSISGGPRRRSNWPDPARSLSAPIKATTSIRADQVLLDGRLVDADKAVVSVFDRGLLYGESLFETLKVVDQAPCLWPAHRDRLAAGCRELGLPLDLEVLEDGVRRLLLSRPITHGSLRIQVTGGQQPGGGRGLLAPSEGRGPVVIAALHETSPYPAEVYTGGVPASLVGGVCRPLPWLKSGSYLASVKARAQAAADGSFEGIFSEGDPPEILEGSFSNVILWDGDRLVTPPHQRVLPGVTCGEILEVAREAGMEVAQEAVPVSSVRGNGLLLTSSLLGVCFCRTLDGAPLAPLGTLATRLQDGLRQREEVSVSLWQQGQGGPRSRR